MAQPNPSRTLPLTPIRSIESAPITERVLPNQWKGRQGHLPSRVACARVLGSRMNVKMLFVATGVLRCARIFFLYVVLAGYDWVALATSHEVPNFSLLDLRGQNQQLRRVDNKAVVLFFTGNGCPIARQSIGKLK